MVTKLLWEDYEEMDLAKDSIKIIYKVEEAKYIPIWDI